MRGYDEALTLFGDAALTETWRHQLALMVEDDNVADAIAGSEFFADSMTSRHGKQPLSRRPSLATPEGKSCNAPEPFSRAFSAEALKSFFTINCCCNSLTNGSAN